jgi:hypothetical protein
MVCVATHKYHVGQRVTFVGPGYMRHASADYRIVRLLPAEAGQLLYRVKSEMESHDRVFNEDQIAARLSSWERH